MGWHYRYHFACGGDCGISNGLTIAGTGETLNFFGAMCQLEYNVR